MKPAGSVLRISWGDGANRALPAWREQNSVTFSELVRELENAGFRKIREKGSIRYYGRPGWPRLIRVDYHGTKEVPTGTCHAILKAAGLKLK
jgi:predicted RNA binding protein YcfA (HicA-like mRNA interferase family)